MASGRLTTRERSVTRAKVNEEISKKTGTKTDDRKCGKRPKSVKDTPASGCQFSQQWKGFLKQAGFEFK